MHQLKGIVFYRLNFLVILWTYPLLVRLLVEVIEQEVEHDGVQQDDPSECLRVIALSEQQLGRVDEHHNELDLKKTKKR